MGSGNRHEDGVSERPGVRITKSPEVVQSRGPPEASGDVGVLGAASAGGKEWILGRAPEGGVR